MYTEGNMINWENTSQLQKGVEERAIQMKNEGWLKDEFQSVARLGEIL